ncbi:hypothetical protein NMY22_g18828 [Coprinellus aureogranulatus]|nr:hypothetical protein NMY22_g18828 [Coprinellus aureogranulatus]
MRERHVRSEAFLNFSACQPNITASKRTPRRLGELRWSLDDRRALNTHLDPLRPLQSGRGCSCINDRINLCRRPPSNGDHSTLDPTWQRDPGGNPRRLPFFSFYLLLPAPNAAASAAAPPSASADRLAFQALFLELKIPAKTPLKPLKKRKTLREAMHNIFGQSAAGLHRREMQKRQQMVVTTTLSTTVITRPQTTATIVVTRLTRVPASTTARTTPTPTKPTPTTTTATSATSTTTTSTTSTTSTSTSTSTTPTTTSTPLTTDRALPTTTSSSLPQQVTITQTAPAKTSTTSDASTGSTSSGQSAGTIVGIVAGILGGIIVVAAIAAFIVRKMRARKRAREEFDASKFRKSALILDEPKEPHRPRPPSMLERKRNAGTPLPPPSSAYPYSDAASQFTSESNFGRGDAASMYGGPAPSMYGGSQYGGGPQPGMYGAPNPQGAPPMPYGGQNMYNQFPDRNGYGGGYGAGAGVGAPPQGFGGPAPYSPYSQNHPQPPQQFNPGYHGYNGQQQQYHNFGPGQQQMNGNNFSAPGTPVRSNSSGGNAPNPFTERAPSTVNGGSANASPAVTRHDSLSSAHGDDDAAPPAYSDEDGTYANLQRDVKQPIVMSVEGTSSGSAAASSTAASAPSPIEDLIYEFTPALNGLIAGQGLLVRRNTFSIEREIGILQGDSTYPDMVVAVRPAIHGWGIRQMAFYPKTKSEFRFRKECLCCRTHGD